MLIELGLRGWDLGVLRSEAVGRSERKLMLQEGRREICPTNQEASRNSRRGDRHSRFGLTGYQCNVDLVTIASLTLHYTPLLCPWHFCFSGTSQWYYDYTPTSELTKHISNVAF